MCLDSPSVHKSDVEPEPISEPRKVIIPGSFQWKHDPNTNPNSDPNSNPNLIPDRVRIQTLFKSDLKIVWSNGLPTNNNSYVGSVSKTGRKQAPNTEEQFSARSAAHKLGVRIFQLFDQYYNLSMKTIVTAKTLQIDTDLRSQTLGLNVMPIWIYY